MPEPVALPFEQEPFLVLLFLQKFSRVTSLLDGFGRIVLPPLALRRQTVFIGPDHPVSNVSCPGSFERSYNCLVDKRNTAQHIGEKTPYRVFRRVEVFDRPWDFGEPRRDLDGVRTVDALERSLPFGNRECR